MLCRTSEQNVAALLLLYCCFTAALLLLYCCFTAALLSHAGAQRERGSAAMWFAMAALDAAAEQEYEASDVYVC